MSLARLAAGILVAGMVVVGTAEAQTSKVKLNGGNSTLAGFLNGINYTGATWELNANVDNVPNGTAGIFNTYAVNSAVLTLTEGGNSTNYDWYAPTGGNLLMMSESTVPALFFAAFDSASNPIGSFAGVMSAAGVLSPLAQTGSINGGGAIETQFGTFNYTAATGSNSGFIQINASAVPEPGEWAAMGILGAGLAGLVIRKRRAA